MAVCKYCGAELKEDYLFCAECGRKVDSKQEPIQVNEIKEVAIPVQAVAINNEIKAESTANLSGTPIEPKQEYGSLVNVISSVKVSCDEISNAVMKNKYKLEYSSKTLKEDVNYAYGKKVSSRKLYGLKSDAIPKRYCPYCGEENQINFATCKKCGRALQRMGLVEATEEVRFVRLRQAREAVSQKVTEKKEAFLDKRQEKKEQRAQDRLDKKSNG